MCIYGKIRVYSLFQVVLLNKFVDIILKYAGIQCVMLLKAACYIYSFTFR